MHSSIFSYNLTRSYPFRWITPVVLIGGLVATALVSFLNLATAGYQLVSITSTDGNETQSTQTWFDRWPSFMVGKMQASCESAVIPLDSQFYTNNSALAHVLTGVWRTDETGQTTNFGSLVYQNNLLANCSINWLLIEINGMSRPAGSIAIQQTGATLTAFTRCGISSGLVLGVTTSYDLLPDMVYPSLVPFFSFLTRNSTGKSSLYFGEPLLAMYWIQLTNAYQLENQKSGSHYFKGTITLGRSQLAPTTAEEIKSIDFFDSVTCYFVPFNGTGMVSVIDFCRTSPDHTSLGSVMSDGLSPLPDIWQPADFLAKSLYYSVMADLGQHYLNPLVDPDLLEYFTQNFSDFTAAQSPWGDNIVPNWGLANQSYTAQNASSYNLGINASTISTSYLCQIPQLKSSGTLVFAVLVADLVLLQGLWTLFKLMVDGCLINKTRMKSCEGCVRERKLLT